MIPNGKQIIIDGHKVVFESEPSDCRGCFFENRDSCPDCDDGIWVEENPSPWHTGTPTEREWVLGIFREVDTGWINPIPFVCEYLQGLKTKATTEEGWIIKDCTDKDRPCDYYKKLQCIAWQKIEPYKETVK